MDSHIQNPCIVSFVHMHFTSNKCRFARNTYPGNEILPPFQIINRFGFSRYIAFAITKIYAMSRKILNAMYSRSQNVLLEWREYMLTYDLRTYDASHVKYHYKGKCMY